MAWRQKTSHTLCRTVVATVGVEERNHLMSMTPTHGTRYVIRHEDGRFLALGHIDQRVVLLWLPEEMKRKAWTWASMTSAILAMCDVDQADLSASGPWTVEAI